MRSYRLERFCISGAGIKRTELMPNILRIEAKDTRRDTQTHGLPLEEVGRGTRASLWSRPRTQQYPVEAAFREGERRDSQARDLPFKEVGEGRGIAIEAGLAHSSSRADAADQP